VDDTGLRQELLVGIDDNLGNMSLVLDNLVQFTVLRRGTLVLDLEAIDLQKWLPPLLAKWRSTALRLGLNWGEQLVSDPLLVYADAERLAQVMSNLLSNTIQHTPDNGSVIVISGSTGTDAWIRIHNSGPGLTFGERQRVFEPFFASATQGTFPRGVGLGLVVAEWLIRAHNGGMELESDVGEGCSFTVRLPLETLTD
jgi:signal transduction histidine kinase